MQVLFDLSFQGDRVLRTRIKDDIPAGNKRLDIRKAYGFKQTAQMVHLDGVTTDIYGSQQGNVFGHDVYRKLPTKSALKRSAPLSDLH